MRPCFGRDTGKAEFWTPQPSDLDEWEEGQWE
jgi:hypothetical protein